MRKLVVLIVFIYKFSTGFLFYNSSLFGSNCQGAVIMRLSYEGYTRKQTPV